MDDTLPPPTVDFAAFQRRYAERSAALREEQRVEEAEALAQHRAEETQRLADAAERRVRYTEACVASSREAYKRDVARAKQRGSRVLPLAASEALYDAMACQRLSPRTSPQAPRSHELSRPWLPWGTEDPSSPRRSSSPSAVSPSASRPASPSPRRRTIYRPPSPLPSSYTATPPSQLQEKRPAWSPPASPQRSPRTPRTPRTLQVWLGDLNDQPWHGSHEWPRRSSSSWASRPAISATPSHFVSSHSSHPRTVAMLRSSTSRADTKKAADPHQPSWYVGPWTINSAPVIHQHPKLNPGTVAKDVASMGMGHVVGQPPIRPADRVSPPMRRPPTFY
eukprot:Transcript_18744.p1 GENE.Transcript_18744~~Transcript_18744.p1  ORF type:complete len:336 (+),score=0.88 Transcript_18744:71-1078(+)